MAKKKSRKKHQFKHIAPTVASGASTIAPAQVSNQPNKSTAPTASFEVANLGLIMQDVRKVAVLASSFVLLQAVLWFLFNHTSFGTSVYHLIKL